MVVTAGRRGVTAIQWVEGTREAAEHPTVPRTDPQRRGYSAGIHSAEADMSWLKESILELTQPVY